jgi:hypothetical protein
MYFSKRNEISKSKLLGISVMVLVHAVVLYELLFGFGSRINFPEGDLTPQIAAIRDMALPVTPVRSNCLDTFKKTCNP